MKTQRYRSELFLTPIRKTAGLLAICCLIWSAKAIDMTFFGEDLGLGETTALTAFPNATAAEANFFANLTGVGTETFEGFAAGTSTPLVLMFAGSGTATLNGTGAVAAVPWGTSNGVGRYNVDGPGSSNYFETGTTSFTINFSTPVAAFGFYGIDIGDFSGQLMLTFLDGTTRVIMVPHTVNGPGGSVLFFGYVNDNNPFTQIMFMDTDPAGDDFFGFDRMTVGSVEQVIGAGNGLRIALPQRELLLNLTRVGIRDINGRLFRLRSAAAETIAPPEPPPSDGKTVMMGKNVFSGKDYKEMSPAPVAEAFKRFSFFASGDFGSTDQDDDLTPGGDELVGFDGETWAATAGAEYRVTRQFTLGLGVSYLQNETDFNLGLGDVEIEGFAISPYLSWANRSFYFDALYSAGLYENRIERNTFGGGSLTGNPDSTNHTFVANAGYKFHFGQVVTGPIASLEYISGCLDGYTEAGAAGLIFNEQDYASLISSLGWQASLRIATSWGAIVPQLRASWERENLDDNELVVARRNGFNMTGRAGRPGDDYAAIGGGVMVEMERGCAVIADVEKHLARENRDDLFASLRLKLTF